MIQETNAVLLSRINKGIISTVLILVQLFISSQADSQIARFQNYNLSDGLCHPFIYNINQDKNGFIWIGTGEGLCRYDGFEFVSSMEFDSLPVDVVSVSYSDSLGKLWFGFNNGQIWSYDGNYFTSHALPEDISTSITAISQSSNEGIIIATQNQGFFKFDENGSAIPFSPDFSDMIISALHIRNDIMLVGTQEGLFYNELSSIYEKEPTAVKELSYTKVQTIKDAYNGNSFWIGTEDAGLYLLTITPDTLNIKPVGIEQGLEYENIQDVIFDSDSNLWMCTYYSGLIHLFFDRTEKGHINSIKRYNKTNSLPTDDIKCAFQDTEGNLWVGTYGSGFVLQSGQAFSFYNYSDSPIGNNILSVTTDDNYIWLGGENGILQINQINNQQKFLNSGNNLPKDAVTSLFYNKKILWIGTSSNGIYKYDIKSGKITSFFKGQNSISNSINYLTGDNDNLYAATKNGIFIIDKLSGQRYHYNTINGLPHNNIEHLFLDSENRLLFATRTNGIYEINVKGEVEDYFTVGKYELDFNSIAQDANGNIWVSTYGQGVFLLMPDSVVNITVKDGLKSDYCYSVIATDSLYLWVGHRLGLSRIEINSHTVSVYDADKGITGDCNHNAVLISPDQNIYFGTTDGLLKYDIEKGYKVKSFPNGNILRVVISDKEYDFREPIVLPYKAYKLRVDFIGLFYTDPEAVRYQYKLEGYDLDWSEITDLRWKIYSRIEDGEYKFLLRSFGVDGVTSAEPVSFSLKVKLPVWKTWWFISLSLIIIVFAMVLIIKVRERRQKQIQEYLEQRLDERTREVVEQKEEIEIKNRDITDSINYAQRIQTSILPPIKRLQANFSGSFIFYQPRDIVSGDFYWFDKISDNKFIIVCADSTGHGVPGAFMSMIGTTLIKDICMREDIKAPSEILRELDSELRSTLNQNIEAEQSNDGMDIIVCEIDTRSNYLRYASAMRPMIVYRGGEQIYIKGSRSSVGGQYDKEDKVFKDEGVQLDKGDLIYMFSDGYPDQFGGSVGKKFKMVRLKNLLSDIHQKPMEEQYEYVKSTFVLWKEDFDQVDDVLFMGIKI